MRIATESVDALRYKLSCFGVWIIGQASIFCDNKLVVTTASMPTSMLNKCHNEIFYHKVRESQLEGNIIVRCVPGESNSSDLLTKNTMAGNARN